MCIYFWKNLIVYPKLGLSSKRIKISKGSNSAVCSFPPEFISYVFSSEMHTKKCYENSIFSELVDLRKQNKNKTKKSTQRFLGIVTYNSCANFQGKVLNPTLVAAPGSLLF